MNKKSLNIILVSLIQTIIMQSISFADIVDYNYNTGVGYGHRR